MSGEMVTHLRGLQAGDAESFTCLYAVTNPLLVRYLRVVTDADPAPLALATWSTLLNGIAVCAASDDDEWLELAVSVARERTMAAALTAGSRPPPSHSAALPGGSGGSTEPDPVTEGVAALRACGPAAAEVLAMGVVAGLGRDSIARITGLEPTAVLTLVLDAQTRLGLPLASLRETMQGPSTPAEVSDLPAVLRLFTAQVATPVATTPVATTPAAAAATTAGVVDLISWGATQPATETRAGRRAAAAAAAAAARRGGAAGAGRQGGAAAALSPRLVRVGAGAAAWTVAVGGVAAAAAMIGVAPAAFNSLFGNAGAGSQGVIAAHGPTRPGGTPSPTPAGPDTTPPPSTPQAGQQTGAPPLPQGSGAGPTGTGAPSGGGGVDVSTSVAGLAARTKVVVASAVLQSPSPAPAAATTSTAAASGIPTSFTPAPPATGTGTGKVTTAAIRAGATSGTGHLKHSTGQAKGASAKTRAAAKTKPKAKGKTKAKAKTKGASAR